MINAIDSIWAEYGLVYENVSMFMKTWTNRKKNSLKCAALKCAANAIVM